MMRLAAVGQRALDALAPGTVAVGRPEPQEAAVGVGLRRYHYVYSFKIDLINKAER